VSRSIPKKVCDGGYGGRNNNNEQPGIRRTVASEVEDDAEVISRADSAVKFGI
jgi:hypothetical protein